MDTWSILSSYTYTRVRATAGEYGGNLDSSEQIEGIPENSASLRAMRHFSDFSINGFKLGVGVRYIDRIGDGTGNVSVPSVTLFDALASYDRQAWRFALNANNVTDKSCLAVCPSRRLLVRGLVVGSSGPSRIAGKDSSIGRLGRTLWVPARALAAQRIKK